MAVVGECLIGWSYEEICDGFDLEQQAGGHPGMHSYTQFAVHPEGTVFAIGLFFVITVFSVLQQPLWQAGAHD